MSVPQNIPIVWHSYPANLAGIVKTLQMFSETENTRALRCFVKTYPFEHTQTIMKRMGEYMNVCLVPIYEFSIHPDL